jgi:hypothetical protein
MKEKNRIIQLVRSPKNEANSVTFVSTFAQKCMAKLDGKC